MRINPRSGMRQCGIMQATRFRRKRTVFAAAVIAGGILLTGCSSSTRGSTTSAADRTLTVGLSAGPVSLDPSKDSFTAQTMRTLTNASITHIRPDGSIGPGLATSFHYVGTGNTEFEFTLRHDARFSDGTPVTAQAVKTWLNYFAQGTGAAAAYMKIASIETIGQWTVLLHLAAPNPLVAHLLDEEYNWGAVSSPYSVAHPAILGTQTFGAGPYVLARSQTVTNDKYTLIPNKYYYDKSAVKWTKVVFNIIPTPSSMLESIKSGQIDVAAGDLSTASEARSSGLDVVGFGGAGGTQGFLIADRNGKAAKPLADVRVRQALNYAINRKAITDALTAGYGTPTSEVMSSDGFDQKYESYYSYNPKKAKELLAAAGHPNGGITLNVLWLSAAAQPSSNVIVQAVAKDLSAVGIQLNEVDAASAGDYVAKQKSASIPLMLFVGNGSMAQIYSLDFNPSSPVNPFRADDPVLDRLAAQADTASNPSAYWSQMSQRITSQAYAIPVFIIKPLLYVSHAVGGVSGAYTWASEWYPR